MSRRRVVVDLDLAAKRYAAGLTIGEIASSMSMSDRTLARAIAANPGHFPPRAVPRPPKPNFTEERVATLLAKGMSKTEVAREIGVDPSAVSRMVKANPNRFPALAHPKVAKSGAKRAAARTAPAPIVEAEPIVAAPDPVVAIVETAAVPADPVDVPADPVVTETVAASAPLTPDDRPIGAAAFRPLLGTTPVRLCEAKARGCRWPVHVDGSDPFRTNTVFVCDAPRCGDKLPYCATHRACHGGRGSNSERAAHRTLLAAA